MTRARLRASASATEAMSAIAASAAVARGAPLRLRLLEDRFIIIAVSARPSPAAGAPAESWFGDQQASDWPRQLVAAASRGFSPPRRIAAANRRASCRRRRFAAEAPRDS